jgi:hypothetical protein
MDAISTPLSKGVSRTVKWISNSLVPLGFFHNKKRRAWVQGGLGTSATLHARHLAMGTRVLACYASAGPIHCQAAARAACFGVLASASALAFRRACCARV